MSTRKKQTKKLRTPRGIRTRGMRWNSDNERVYILKDSPKRPPYVMGELTAEECEKLGKWLIKAARFFKQESN